MEAQIVVMRKIEQSIAFWRDQFPELDDDELKLFGYSFLLRGGRAPFMLFCIPNHPDDDKVEMWEKSACLNAHDKARLAHNEKTLLSRRGRAESVDCTDRSETLTRHHLHLHTGRLRYVFAAIYDKPWATIQ